MKNFCPAKCPYLLKELGSCVRPELNGWAKRLKQDDYGRFEKVCSLPDEKTEKKKKSSKKIDPLLCSNTCPHLMKDFGCCVHPDYKGKAQKLMRSEDGFLRVCGAAGEVTKKNKYNSAKISVNGITYDSTLEYRRHMFLKQMEKAGEIKDLKYHVRFVLLEKSEYGREIAYEADFVYTIGKDIIVEDTKSAPTKTRLYKLKKRLMAEKYGIIVREISYENCESLD